MTRTPTEIPLWEERESAGAANVTAPCVSRSTFLLRAKEKGERERGRDRECQPGLSSFFFSLSLSRDTALHEIRLHTTLHLPFQSQERAKGGPAKSKSKSRQVASITLSLLHETDCMRSSPLTVTYTRSFHCGCV